MKPYYSAIIFFLGILAGCGGMKEFFHPEPDQIIIGEIDLKSLPDSHFLGTATCGPVRVKLLVEVEDHFIKAIDIAKHRTGQGQPAEILLQEVLMAQDLQVDVISGATISSKAILKAIENALNP